MRASRRTYIFVAVHAERLDLFDYLAIVVFGAGDSICAVGSWGKLVGFLANRLEELGGRGSRFGRRVAGRRHVGLNVFSRGLRLSVHV